MINKVYIMIILVSYWKIYSIHFYPYIRLDSKEAARQAAGVPPKNSHPSIRGVGRERGTRAAALGRSSIRETELLMLIKYTLLLL
jgi:hypothetical protein